MGLYSIWVAEFASIEQFPEALMISGNFGGGIRRLPYTYMVIQGQGRTILVDVGFAWRDYAKAFVSTMGVNNWQPPKVVLGDIGIKPEDVTDIIITHAHFDHMGGMEYFPNAVFHIQERELAKWVWGLTVEARFQKLHFCTNPEDILTAVRLGTEGRLKCVQGDMENIFPGIDLHLAEDTHTWGSQYITVRNDGQAQCQDAFVLAGDLVYTYDNLGLTPESGGAYSTIVQAIGGQYALMQATEALVQAVGGDAYRVIPAHENRLGQTYPSRVNENGLRLTEITLGDGVVSKVG
jgi:N-acyl homoserine lactone hydrolase